MHEAELKTVGIDLFHRFQFMSIQSLDVYIYIAVMIPFHIILKPIGLLVMQTLFLL